MKIALHGKSQTWGQTKHVTLARGIGWGLIGGLVGTLVMDLVLMGVLSAAGLPAIACFTIVGDTVARFFSILSLPIAGGVPLGVATHYLVGPVIGAIYGAAVVRVGALRVNTLKRCVVIAIIYLEIVSQPILATTPILLQMTTNETLQWFGVSFVMHAIMAAVLGVVVGYGLQLANAANRDYHASAIG